MKPFLILLTMICLSMPLMAEAEGMQEEVNVLNTSMEVDTDAVIDERAYASSGWRTVSGRREAVIDQPFVSGEEPPESWKPGLALGFGIYQEFNGIRFGGGIAECWDTSTAIYMMLGLDINSHNRLFSRMTGDALNIRMYRYSPFTGTPARFQSFSASLGYMFSYGIYGVSAEAGITLLSFKGNGKEEMSLALRLGAEFHITAETDTIGDHSVPIDFFIPVTYSFNNNHVVLTTGLGLSFTFSTYES